MTFLLNIYNMAKTSLSTLLGTYTFILRAMFRAGTVIIPTSQKTEKKSDD